MRKVRKLDHAEKVLRYGMVVGSLRIEWLPMAAFGRFMTVVELETRLTLNASGVRLPRDLKRCPWAYAVRAVRRETAAELRQPCSLLTCPYRKRKTADVTPRIS
jgi:hypothetical protein